VRRIALLVCVVAVLSAESSAQEKAQTPARGPIETQAKPGDRVWIFPGSTTLNTAFSEPRKLVLPPPPGQHQGLRWEVREGGLYLVLPSLAPVFQTAERGKRNLDSVLLNSPEWDLLIPVPGGGASGCFGPRYGSEETIHKVDQPTLIEIPLIRR
jgi:hypothetical protein